MRADTPSATAHLIALGTVLLECDPMLRCLVPPGAGEASRWFVEAYSSRGKHWLRLMEQGWFRTWIRCMERITLPGILIHYALRKRYLEDVARSSLKSESRQMILLGGGFDTLALRLHSEFPAVRFIEVDHPATQRVKATALDGRLVAGRNLDFLPMDFTRHSLEDRLPAHPNYDPDLPTLFVMEGVLMYLDLAGVERIFSFIRGRSGPGSRFAFTFMEPDAQGRVDFRNCSPAVRLWLRLKGEPFRWGVSRGDLPGFLETQGFVLKETTTSDTFRRRYLDAHGLEQLPLAEGEHVCVSEKP